jgi:hypothetical protein
MRPPGRPPTEGLNKGLIIEALIQTPKLDP